jgi:hypothetical protein
LRICSAFEAAWGPCDNVDVRFPFAPAIAVSVLLAGLLTSGCGVSEPSKNQTETFSSTLAILGSNSHPFSSGSTGEFSVSLTSVTPDANAILILSFGQPSGNTCLPFQGYVVPARVNNPPNPLTGQIQKGNYCIGVQDTGSLTRAESYTITVSHP